MKRISILLVALAMLMFGITTSAQAATTPTINPTAAPTGTHLQTGTIGCSGDPVICTAFELAGVGNANAKATLSTTYTATVQCRNHGNQIVEVKSQVKTADATTGPLVPKNGRLTVPELSSSPPDAGDFVKQATCPNGNWTKELLGGTITLSSFTYTLHFFGFTGNYITITGP